MSIIDVDYEIKHFEVNLYLNGVNLGGENIFGREEDAIDFARQYNRDHPEWDIEVLCIQYAVGWREEA